MNSARMATRSNYGAADALMGIWGYTRVTEHEKSEELKALARDREYAVIHGQLDMVRTIDGIMRDLLAWSEDEQAAEMWVNCDCGRCDA